MSEVKKKKQPKPDNSKKLRITGNSNWLALQKTLGAGKTKNKKAKKRKIEKTDKQDKVDVEASKVQKLEDKIEDKPVSNSDPNLEVKTASELLKLLNPEKSSSSKVATVDYDQLEDLSLEDIESGFGYEMAYNVAKRRKTKEAQYYKKKFLDVEDAKARDNPDYKEISETELSKKLIKTTKDNIDLTKFLAMDCEMVGVGFKGKKSILARVSICNQFGKCVYDKHVIPDQKVVDYRTQVSGVRPADLLEENGALPFEIVQVECREIFRNRVLVGHQLNGDLSVLKIKHPKVNIRDTAKYFTESYGRTPSLKLLVRDFLEVGFQSGEHSSVQDAQATMRIYTMHKKKWERELKTSKNNKDNKGSK